MVTMFDMNRLPALMLFGLLSASTILAVPPARADPLGGVVDTIRQSGGRYVRAGASLSGSDCSGLVSVAQSLATGQPVHRLGDTRSLIAGHWPGVINGAAQGDRFIIAANYSHMVAQVDGVGIEATTSGAPYKVGPSAASVWDPRFTTRVHVRDDLLIS